jgi:hypothetical protein
MVWNASFRIDVAVEAVALIGTPKIYMKDGATMVRFT